MTIRDLIKNKDYDYIEYRIMLPNGNDIFVGCFSLKSGEFISLDGDNYNKDEEILSYREWSNFKENIKNGLTIIS